MHTGTFFRCFGSGLVLLLFACVSVSAQSLPRTIKQHLGQVKKGKHPETPSFKDIKAAQQKEVLKTLSGYYKDTSEVVRREAFKLTHNLGQASSRDRIRKSVVNTLVEGLQDQDASIVGYIDGKLPQYAKDAFSEEARKKLRTVILNDPPHFNRLVKLGGYLEISSLKAPLIRKIRETNMGSQEMWAAHLALARMGEAKAANYLVKKIQKMDLNDDVVEELLPGLAYTCSRPAFEYLETVVMSDKKQCTPTNPHQSGKIKCAYRVLEIITPYIKGFPIEAGPMGSLDTDDYEKALKKARTWLQKHEDYSLNRQVYKTF